MFLKYIYELLGLFIIWVDPSRVKAALFVLFLV